MSERLRHTREVRAVLGHGRAAQGKHAMLRSLARDDEHPARWTVSANRRVGSAVTRNRAKRRLRAALRETVLPPGHDLVVIARPSAVSCEFDELVGDVGALVRRGRRSAETQS
jgi:ribonuclease P protein component